MQMSVVHYAYSVRHFSCVAFLIFRPYLFVMTFRVLRFRGSPQDPAAPPTMRQGRRTTFVLDFSRQVPKLSPFMLFSIELIETLGLSHVSSF